ncbi:MAG: tetratricopeptide repeat protein [Bacteroidetes bacterium]|nr:tetratricopeptide repeat protein [Bacteroidota bacterium]
MTNKQAIEFKNFRLTAFLFLFYFFSVQEFYCQNKTIDSLLSLIKTEKEDTNKVNSFNDISRQYRLISDLTTSLNYANSAMELSKRLHFTNGTAYAYTNIALYYYHKGNYAEALKENSLGMEIYKVTNNKQGLSNAYNSFGLIYRHQGNYPEALKNFLVALHINEELGRPEGIAYACNNVGNVYAMQENYTEALKNYSHSLDIRKKINDRQGIGDCYLNIGNIYYETHNYDDALKNYKAALEIFLVTGDKRGVAMLYGNMGDIYYTLENYPEAMKSLLMGKKINEEVGDKDGIAVSCVNLASLCISMKNFSSASAYLDSALSLSLEVGSKRDCRDTYNCLVKLDTLKLNYKKAFEDYKMFITYRDSLVNEENTKKTVQTQMQYDFDKKTSADSIKNTEQKKRDDLKHTQEIQQQKIYSYGGAAGFLLMLIVAIVSVRAFRNKQRANEIISRQKELVEEKQKEILDSIHYAKRIQQSLLPNAKLIERHLKSGSN